MISSPIWEKKYGVDNEDEIVGGTWVNLVKVTQNVDSYVAPQEEAAKVKFKEKATNKS